MPEHNRSIGGQGLEQGGPNLGNDITREDLSIKNAGDPLTSPKPMNAENSKRERDMEEDDLEEDIDTEDFEEEEEEEDMV